MNIYVGQYGIVAMFALVELGVKVKVRERVWSVQCGAVGGEGS